MKEFDINELFGNKVLYQKLGTEIIFQCGRAEVLDTQQNEECLLEYQYTKRNIIQLMNILGTTKNAKILEYADKFGIDLNLKTIGRDDKNN